MSAVTAGAQWVKATDLDELWEDELLPVSVKGVALVLVNVGGEVYAYRDSCPHVGTPLSDGCLDGGELVCASHLWTFQAAGGRGVNPAHARLERYAVRVEGNDVCVDLNQVLQRAEGL